MPCNCGKNARQTITTADAEAMRLAREAGVKYVVTDPEGNSTQHASYLEAVRAKRTTGGTLANVR